MTIKNKQNEINSLNWEINKCKGCDLYKINKCPVKGNGNLDAQLMLLGEAPGREENIHRLPFVGDSGMLLDIVLGCFPISKKEIYTTNVNKHRPYIGYKNRRPEQKEIDACLPFLYREIEIIQPKVIIALGKTAFFALMGEHCPMERGMIYDVGINCRLITTYHPSYCVQRGGTSNQKLFNKMVDHFRVAYNLIKE